MRSMTTSIAILAFLTAPLSAADLPRTISVSGQGKVSASPDMASIQTGVESQAPTAGEALTANNEAMKMLMKVLKREHVASKDIQTSSFSVSPVYRRDSRNRTQPEITGYRVQNQLHVKVRDLPNLGKVLDALVRAGSNRISGISFGVDDTSGLLNQARSRAMSDAKSRAGIYAQAAGVTVGKVLTISEQPVNIPRPFQHRMMFAEKAAASAVPIATGEMNFSIKVNVVYEMKDE